MPTVLFAHLLYSHLICHIVVLQTAKALPTSSTKQHLFTQHGLRVNGPLFASNPLDGPASLLSACRGHRPCVVKLLRGQVLPGDAGKPCDREAAAVVSLQE